MVNRFPNLNPRPRDAVTRLPWRLILASIFVLCGTERADAWRWNYAGIDSSGGVPGQFISMAVDAKGRIHGSYFRFDSDSEGGRNLKYTTCLSPTGSGPWQTTVVDGGASTGTYSSISLTNNNIPHISYYESEFANLKHAWYDSTAGAWLKEVVDSPGTVGQYSAMGVDTVSNTLYISYFDATASGLKVARKAPGGLWTFGFADTGSLGLYTSIDVTGIVRIAYYDLAKRNLKFAEQAGNNWNITTIDSVGDVGRYTSIGVAQNQVWISYYDVTNKKLKFAERSLGVWTTITLDASGDAGSGTALAVGPAGRPAIVYYDAMGQNLKYAERFNGTWLFSTIATGGNVGRYAGLSIGPEDLPNTLYYDETQGKLRFAHGFGGTTGVPEDVPVPDALPFVLSMPENPSRSPVILDLAAPVSGPISVRIFDVSGRALREVFTGNVESGTHRFSWNGLDESGRFVPSGVYFGAVRSQRGRASARFVLVR